MTPNDRTKYEVLLDLRESDESDKAARLDVPGDIGVDELGLVLASALADPEVDRIAVSVDGCPIGVTTRGYLAPLLSGSRSLGSGDAASLIGPSSRFRAVRFGCRLCDQVVLRPFYDERFLPRCPRDVAHGEMFVR
jgi:hypothetical protein